MPGFNWLTTLPALALHLAQATPPPATQPAAAGADQPEYRLATGFLYKTLEFNGEEYAYSVYVPPEYTPDKQWPVILFLHGSGERGTDGFLQTEVGLPSAIRRDYRRVPAVVVMPQCPPGKAWWQADLASMPLACLEKTSSEYRLDPNRIYLTGLSLGGAGVLVIGSSIADKVAAIVPVCGFLGNPREAPNHNAVVAMAEKLKDTPTWFFHGDADESVTVEHSRALVAQLKKRGAEVKYTEYPAVGHVCWDKAYAERELWDWLFEQKLSGSKAAGD